MVMLACAVQSSAAVRLRTRSRYRGTNVAMQLDIMLLNRNSFCVAITRVLLYRRAY